MVAFPRISNVFEGTRVLATGVSVSSAARRRERALRTWGNVGFTKVFQWFRWDFASGDPAGRAARAGACFCRAPEYAVSLTFSTVFRDFLIFLIGERTRQREPADMGIIYGNLRKSIRNWKSLNNNCGADSGAKNGKVYMNLFLRPGVKTFPDVKSLCLWTVLEPPAEI